MRKNLRIPFNFILNLNKFYYIESDLSFKRLNIRAVCVANCFNHFLLVILNQNTVYSFGWTPLRCATKLFLFLWHSEFRSSNLNVKSYNFFFKYHDSAMRTSFYDFLLKTRLLQDEKSFAINYKQRLMRKYRWVKVRERNKYRHLWEKYGLISPRVNTRTRGKAKIKDNVLAK